MMPANSRKPAVRDARSRDLAKIHLARAQLGMDDDTYRDILWTVGRVRSAAELDFAGRARLLEHFRKCGWKPRPPADTVGPFARDPVSRKLRALWLALHQAGAVRDPGERALAAFCERYTKVKSLAWASDADKAIAVEAMKQWLARLEQERPGA